MVRACVDDTEGNTTTPYKYFNQSWCSWVCSSQFVSHLFRFVLLATHSSISITDAVLGSALCLPSLPSCTVKVVTWDDNTGSMVPFGSNRTYAKEELEGRGGGKSAFRPAFFSCLLEFSFRPDYVGVVHGNRHPTRLSPHNQLYPACVAFLLTLYPVRP